MTTGKNQTTKVKLENSMQFPLGMRGSHLPAQQAHGYYMVYGLAQGCQLYVRIWGIIEHL